MDRFIHGAAGFMRGLTDGIFKAQKIVLLIAGGILVALNFASVLGRYIFEYSFPWFSEANIILFALLILLGANIAVKHDNEIKIELFHFKNEKAELVYKIFIDILGILVVAICFISAILFVSQSFRTPSYYAILKFQYAYTYSLMIIGFALIILDKAAMVFIRLDRICRIDEEGADR